MWRGREFQVVGADTEKLPEPKRVWTRGTADKLQCSPVLNLIFLLLPITSSHSHASASDSTFDYWRYINFSLTSSLTLTLTLSVERSLRVEMWLNLTGCEYGDRNVNYCSSQVQRRDCYDTNVQQTCCARCADERNSSAPADCQFGDKASWCHPSQLEPHSCYSAASTCCETCPTYHTGPDGELTVFLAFTVHHRRFVKMHFLKIFIHHHTVEKQKL